MNHDDSYVEDKVEEEKRFVAYISSLLHYNSINFDKKNRKFNERFALILDDTDYKELTSGVEEDAIQNSEILENQISDPDLYATFMNLTTKERQILNLSISKELKNTEIARLLNISEQSVSKTKKTALIKMRREISTLGGSKNG
ncbi:hypothetical protein DC345_30280 [Paenibacillus taichungensis]|uniref:RNA polymerase sigma factor 70 region 4 type 2 domain-containing protein n=1 Tax=Paenibacillus taichungensis TaxID=484184 RepID=A0A329QBG0_9BACL|nr:sigma-70 family RNA polymerase sigma factor [Paenibacillus taichungensis]RAW09750.1 hypothetical protein DC345_30280 [Paenibacillus taichungensis]